MSARSTTRALLATAAIVLVAAIAAARPGGGQSFGGGSRSSSSSSSSGSSRSGSSSSSSGSFRSGSSSSSSSSSGGFRSTSSSSSTSGGSSSFGSRSTSTSSSSSSSGGGSSFGHTSSTSSSGTFGSTSGTPGYYSSTSSSGDTTYTAPASSPPLTGDGYTSEGAPAEPLPKRDHPVALALLAVFGAVIVFVLFLIVYSRWQTNKQLASWEATMQEEQDAKVRDTRHANVRSALAAIRSDDDAFSFVLFEDFLYALYAEVHTARAAGKIEPLAPYLSAEAQAQLARLPANGIDAIVIGGMRIESIVTSGSKVKLDVVFTANLAETDFVGKPAAVYSEECWRLSRDVSARSRAPEKARVIGCPSCGAPLDKMIGGKCGYCGVSSKPGEHDWFVENVTVVARENRGPMLTGTTEEVGTDWPTVIASDVKSELDALRARDAAFSWSAFVARVGVVFAAFHESWSAQDLAAVRPFLSDNLFELQQYWVRAYQQQGLHNLTENPLIVTVHLARITRDRFFDAVTVRVFASCVDYTTDAKGAVVGGDRDHRREYSEYWTFIRGAGKSATPRSDLACPSCGGSLAGINMAGECSHCNVKVTTGEFDWVLSRIEQDEVYEAAA
jgi:hypothetical protein